MPETKPYGINKLRTTWVVKESVRRSMQSNTSTETEPERLLRAALYGAGLRGYRKNVRRLPGTPDVVFGPAMLAVFVHGCYWHRCPKCTRNVHPKTNREFWAAKFERNVERDKANKRELRRLGYRVLTFWECEVRKDAVRCAVKVMKALDATEQI
ncbi:MAG TPA: very short patch repair endonuclease [Fimbriimonadaceae bacterium]|nr:very short patch repair endonuclease [Fimbriimonadaceae bacterium]